MRKRKVIDRRLDNKGLSLVELLVSVAILAIIVLPLLSAFVQASKTNAKAKNKLRASELAYNVMEGLENVTLESVAYQFNYAGEGFSLFSLSPTSEACELEHIAAGGTGSFVKVTKAEDVRGEVANKEDLITSSIIKNSDGTYKFAGQDSHKYYFYVKDITADNKKYDALLTIDAKTNDAGSIHETVNKQKVAKMESVDTTFDGVSADTDRPRDVLVDISGIYGLDSIKQEDITRIITVDVSSDKNTNRQMVKVSYRYKFFDTNTGRYVTFPEAGSIYENDYTNVIYDNSSHKEDSLRNVFLLYYPWYTSTGLFPTCTDQIVINNPDYTECTMHIIKQNVVNANQLFTYEKDYKTAIYLNEYDNKTGKAYMKIESNLGSNMKDLSDAPNQATYIFNNSFANQDAIKDIISIRKLNEQDASDRLFDVSIDIFPKGTDISDITTAKSIVSITGGMTD